MAKWDYTTEKPGYAEFIVMGVEYGGVIVGLFLMGLVVILCFTLMHMVFIRIFGDDFAPDATVQGADTAGVELEETLLDHDEHEEAADAEDAFLDHAAEKKVAAREDMLV